MLTIDFNNDLKEKYSDKYTSGYLFTLKYDKTISITAINSKYVKEESIIHDENNVATQLLSLDLPDKALASNIEIIYNNDKKVNIFIGR